MKDYSGFFLTFEGIEGTGKSTHARRLFSFLEESGFPCVFTVEPGGTEVGEQIRSILLHPKTGGVDPLTELFLFEASRREHVLRIILPALRLGKIVICVRFSDSTVAYQGYGRNLPISTVQDLNQLATGGLIPDLTVLLDVDPEEGLKRSFHHTSPHELRFEEEFSQKKEVLTTIREGFLHIAEEEPKRFKVISTSEPKSIVFEKIKTSVLSAIDETKKGDTL